MRSLAKNYLSSQNIGLRKPFIEATTEDLQDMIEGYENVFKASAKIKIALNVVGV